jgi:hypothetical protein
MRTVTSRCLSPVVVHRFWWRSLRKNITWKTEGDGRIILKHILKKYNERA